MQPGKHSLVQTIFAYKICTDANSVSRYHVTRPGTCDIHAFLAVEALVTSHFEQVSSKGGFQQHVGQPACAQRSGHSTHRQTRERLVVYHMTYSYINIRLF